MGRFALSGPLALAMLAIPAVFGSAARADLTFATATGATAGGQAVDALATLHFSGNTLTVTVTNLENNPTSDIQSINGLNIVFANGQTTGSLTSSSAQQVTINGSGGYTLGSTGSTDWLFNSNVNDGSGAGVEITTIGNAHAPQTIIGGPGSNGYSNANPSITNHNPFLYETATFTLTIPNLSSTTVSNLYFEYGTQSGSDVLGVPQSSAQTVPEPASVAMMLLGGGMAAGYAGYRRRKAHKALATA
jgi:PEP-CTERM motif